MSFEAIASKLYVALIHSPVLNRHKEVVTSSVTNLDLHDIARSSKTYGLAGYFVVHPSSDQQALNRRIINHWAGGYGFTANPTRKDALDLISLVSNVEEAIEAVQTACGQAPLLVGTSAKEQPGRSMSIEGLREALKERPGLLLFGTGYGLAPEWSEKIEAFLPPIWGPSPFNHLSVRSAASIYFDRLFGA